MAEFSTVMEVHRRMCKVYTRKGCKDCPVASGNSGVKTTCFFLMKEHSEVFENIVMNWAENNPHKTLADRFFGMFPNAPKTGGKSPKMCVKNLGWYDGECLGMFCNDCWSKPWEENE